MEQEAWKIEYIKTFKELLISGGFEAARAAEFAIQDYESMAEDFDNDDDPEMMAKESFSCWGD